MPILKHLFNILYIESFKKTNFGVAGEIIVGR